MSLNIPDCSFFCQKIATLRRKKSAPSKNWGPVKPPPPFLKILYEVQPPLPPSEKGGAHYVSLVVQTTLRSVLNSKQGSRQVLLLITCFKSASLGMCMKSTSNINKNQKWCFTGLFKLFVTCSGWRILKHCLNHIFHCHLLRIFESFQGTCKTPTFIFLIKTNAQLHLKMLSCNFDFLKNLTDFRPIILHLVKKSKSSFKERLPFKYLFLA